MVELQLAFDGSGAYRIDQLLAQCNEQLGTSYPLEDFRGQTRQLTPAERAALLLADELGFVEAQLTPERLTLRLPASDDKQQIQAVRRLLRGWLKIPADYWTDEHGLQIPADFDPQRPALVVIAGLESCPGDLEPFAEACAATGLQFLPFYYPNDGPLAAASRRLGAALEDLAIRYPNTQLSMVGLSMGGLVARQCLEAPDSDHNLVRDLFLVGTPNGGSGLAGAHHWLELAAQIAPGGVDGMRAACRDGFGEAAEDLRPGSKFLTALNAQPRAEMVRYHVGIGTRSFLTVEQRAQVSAEVERLLATRPVPAALQRELKGIVTADEWMDGVADGAVTIRSARLVPCHSERHFALNHFELIALPGDDPARSAVFEWILTTIDHGGSSTEAVADE